MRRKTLNVECRGSTVSQHNPEPDIYTWIRVVLSVYTSFYNSGPSLQSKMTERTPWWRAFLVSKKKSGGHKDTGSTQTFGPDFNPFEQRADKQKDHAAAAASKSPSQEESSKHSNLLSDDTFDDSQMESVFNEQTCRRNMKVSRSGRFKEKKRVRSTLPIEEKEPETVASGKEDIRRQRGGENDPRLLYRDA